VRRFGSSRRDAGRDWVDDGLGGLEGIER
jgi:hypothetical protein